MKPLILIVDDIEINRAILCEAFHEDYDILEAENGKEALDLIYANTDAIAAVLLDVVMPVMDGFTAIEHLYEDNLLEKIPVFLITAECSEANMRRGYDMGVVDIIEKPIVPYFIKRRIGHVIELYQHREHLRHVVSEQEVALQEKAREIQNLNNSLITSLSTAIEFRDCESGEHVKRMHDITLLLIRKGCGLCEEYSLGEAEISRIATAAIMHDVGKIAIPDSILNKPGRLTDEEFEIMKTHTTKGCELLDSIKDLQKNPIYRYAYDICRYHHERWDGRGYPDGLKEEEIPIWAQVVALADVYDALVSERVYKSAYTHEEAVKMILGGECGMFNPRLMESFRNLEKEIRTIYINKAQGE